MKPTTVILARLVSLLAIAFPSLLQATVTAVGVDSTAGAYWRTAAALDADGQYGTLGYVVFGLLEADNVWTPQYYLNGGTSNAGVANPKNLVSLPAGIGITCQDTNIGMWSGNNGNFGYMQNPASGNALTSTPVLANSSGPRQFTITRATSTGYRITLLTASGDGGNNTYTPSVNDGSGAVSTSYHHTANGLAYHVFQVTPGTSNIVITVTGTINWSLTGIAFDDYVVPPVPLAWVGATSAWDTTTTGNWIKVADSSAAVFSNSAPICQVQFDDTATGTTVDISSGNVTPGTVSFNNTTKNYTLQGTNALAGSIALTKAGTGSLTVLNTNTYSGGTTINGGTLQLGDGTTGHDGAVAGNIANSGALAWDIFGNQTVSGVISGAGSLAKSGTGTLTLSSATSSYSGNITISGGKLLATGSTGGVNPTVGSLGNPRVARTITVNNGGTLSFGNNDILGNAGSIPVVALVVNSGGTVTNNGNYFTSLTSVTLNGGTLTAVGGVNASFPSYSLKGTVTASGSATSTISASGTNAAITVGTDTVTSVTFNVDTDSTLNVPALLTNGTTIGTLTKTGNGALILGGANTYGGTTTVNGGTLAVNGTMASGTNAITVNTGATLTGTGITNRPVAITSGGFLSPAGSSIGTLTTNRSVTFSSGATAVFQIDKTSGTRTQDLLDAGSATSVITYGGTLQITATGDDLAAGDSFKIFNAASYAGVFTTFTMPTLTAGLSWDFSGLATTGTITVVDTTPAPIFSPPGGVYVGAQSVTISSDPGTTIHYTTDGSDPRSSGSVVTTASPASGVVIPTDTASMTLTAYASQSGRTDSANVTAVYATVTKPTWNVDGNGLWSEVAKWLHDVVPNATDVTADFRTVAQSGTATITLDSNRTVGTVLTGNANPYDWNLVTSNGAVLALATTTGTPVIDVASQTTTIGTTVAGSQGFTKTGNGTLKLSNAANAYSGDILVSGGTLLATGSVGPTPTTSSLGDPSLSRTITVDSGGTLTFGSVDVMGNHTSTPAVGLVVNAGGTVTNSGAYFCALGPVTLNGGNLTASGGANATFPSYGLKGSVSAAGGMTSTISASGTYAGYHLGDVGITGTTFNVGDAGILNVTANLNDGRGNTSGYPVQASYLTKTGNGKMVLSGTNGFTGATTVTGGTLELAGGTIASTARTDVNNGATYLVSGGTKTGGLIDVNAGGTYTQTSGAVTCTSQFVVGAHGTSTGSISAGTFTINAPFYIGGYGTGSGTGTFTQTGGDVVVTGGVNYNGGGPNNGVYNLNGGTLTANVFGRNNGVGTGTINFNGGVLLPTASTTVFMQGLTAANVMVSGATINTNTYNITIGQALLHDSALGTTPDGGLTKTGNGTLTLTGTSTYTGNTTVNGGTLAVTGSLGATAVEVKSGATLAGTGTLGGNLTVDSGGHQALAVAATPGAQATRTVTGTMTLTEGNILDLMAATTPANGEYVLITATGGITGSPTTVNLTGTTGSVSINGNQLLLTVRTYYDAWAQSFPGLTDPSPTHDPDLDGKSNLVEYAFGTDPTVATSGAAISYADGVVTGHGQPTTTFTTTATTVDFRAVFGRRSDYLAAGLTYTVEFSADLSEWVTSTDTPATLATDGTIDAVSVPYPPFIETTGGMQKPTYFRVMVTMN